ncbi:hypothetical protein QBC46DRAFT_288431 [Diplogelasinospora grovesii]|uniref:Uncharacterized protein n=1 Tax=Diplogelasinospora grovesii TaxID=303347 RepID=A0AAN6S461_9PEZI|nr:hypothetical protein QBC46DRAFT_288431 [Diplogelasinospora grovesii]
MKFFSLVNCAILAASCSMVAAAPSGQQTQRSVSDIMPLLKRDPSGAGFTHLGSDKVLRSFDAHLNVLDAAALDGRAVDTTTASLLNEARAARERSLQHITTTARTTPKRSGGSGLDERQAQSCVSENCPDDAYCKGLSLYGYNCSSCFMVETGIGNCQT